MRRVIMGWGIFKNIVATPLPSTLASLASGKTKMCWIVFLFLGSFFDCKEKKITQLFNFTFCLAVMKFLGAMQQIVESYFDFGLQDNVFPVEKKIKKA